MAFLVRSALVEMSLAGSHCKSRRDCAVSIRSDEAVRTWAFWVPGCADDCYPLRPNAKPSPPPQAPKSHTSGSSLDEKNGTSSLCRRESGLRSRSGKSKDLISHLLRELTLVELGRQRERARYPSNEHHGPSKAVYSVDSW